MSLTAVHAVELAGLAHDYEISSKKIATLHREHALADSPGRRFDLEQQIENEMLRLEELAAKVTILKLGDALLRLDFVQQVLRFRNTIKVEGVSAFLVRPPGNGDDESQDSIRLLVKRLVTYIPHQIATPLIKIRLESNVKKANADALWRQLARAIGAKASADKREIAERVADRLRTQNVVLVVTDLDRVDLADCMRDFWVPLARQVQQAGPASYHLILLLVDYAGVASLPEPHQPPMPVGLPHVLRFPDDELTAWLRLVVGDLPDESLPAVSDSDEMVSLLMQQLVPAGSPPGPDQVLWQICAIWRCEERELDAWLDI